jgi:hypothetical protein
MTLVGPFPFLIPNFAFHPMTADSHRDWKLKLRYGKTTTEFEHFATIAEGLVVKLSGGFSCRPEKAIFLRGCGTSVRAYGTGCMPSPPQSIDSLVSNLADLQGKPIQVLLTLSYFESLPAPI